MKYIVIVGCGKIGKELAVQLSKTENVVMVDKDLEALNSLGDDFNGKKIWGDALDMNTLNAAGIKEANSVFLITGNDNLNLVVGKVVKRKYEIKEVSLLVNDDVKRQTFQEEGLTIVNRTNLMVGVLKRSIT
ncbi:MAG: NAD-binding protein [Candidatus Omnitrophota bacterium]|nr:MAG: NAD-binding protein [Candidatus Omnitrophota bacterium]